MNELINNQLISKTVHIFNKLFHLNIEPREIVEVKRGDHDWDISGVVGVVGNFEGVITIRLRNGLADRLLEKSRIESPEVSKRWHIINDMVGELINNIVGNMIGEFDNKKLKHSVPITIQGDNHLLQWPNSAPIIKIPFSLDLGHFELQYSLVEK